VYIHHFSVDDDGICHRPHRNSQNAPFPLSSLYFLYTFFLSIFYACSFHLLHFPFWPLSFLLFLPVLYVCLSLRLFNPLFYALSCPIGFDFHKTFNFHPSIQISIVLLNFIHISCQFEFWLFSLSLLKIIWYLLYFHIFIFN
jgi:hypothetical protein